MAFDPTVISGLRADRDGRDWRLSWQSSAPAGAIHQVYLDGRLAWSGPATRCTLPLGGVTAVQVGAVGAGESAADLAGSLPALPGGGRQADLAWYGGTFLAHDLAGFKVFGEPTPGAGIDYGTVLADLVAYPAGRVFDGAGVGPFGQGGAGHAATVYRWRSAPLAVSGTWHHAIKPSDAAGNIGAGLAAAVAVAAPPGPAQTPAGTYNAGTRVLTLTWAAPAY
jgi:hypothetical protein